MLPVVMIVLPVFGLIGVGYAARRVRLVTERAGDGLSEYVFALAVPCLIFKTLARADIPAVQPWGYWVSYFAGLGIVWLIAMVITRRIFHRTPTEAVVAGFLAGQSNTIFVGVPMILKAYGDAGAVPLFLLLAVHLPIIMTIATVLAEGRGTSPARLARRLFTHPIVVAVLLGSFGRLVPLPEVAWTIIDMIASSAVPCALVSMGVALSRYGFEAGWQMPTVLSVLKLIVHPLIVLILATQVFSMPPAWAGVAVLFAASPSGINAYLFAQRYDEGVAIASSTVSLSTLLSIATTIGWLALLGVS